MKVSGRRQFGSAPDTTTASGSILRMNMMTGIIPIIITMMDIITMGTIMTVIIMTEVIMAGDITMEGIMVEVVTVADMAADMVEVVMAADIGKERLC
jgi:hypothetical protein